MKKIIFFLLIILVPNVSCDILYDLCVYNKSDHGINVYLGLGETYYDSSRGSLYPDTVLALHNNTYKTDVNGVYVYSVFSGWDQAYRKRGTDTISVFILHSDTVKKYSWDIIRSEYKVLKRYDLSLRDLRDLNYTIYYPPTRAMRTIKMYPPYGVNE